MKNKGFTVIEILVIIAAIGILVTLIIGGYTMLQDRAQDTAVKSDLRSSGLKIEEAFAATDEYPAASQAGLEDLLYFQKGVFLDGGSSGSVSYCRSNTGFTLYGRSIDKKSYIYSSRDGLKEVSHDGGLSAQCALGGVSNTDDGFASIWLLKGSGHPEGGGWQSWVRGE